VTFIIEHGETTDPLDTFMVLAAGLPEYADGLEDCNIITTEFQVDTPDPLADALASLSWEQRAKVESGKPLKYEATHLSNIDDSDAMCLSTDEDGFVLNLINEDGFTWSDRAKDWRTI
jgi:hypothetical protein